MSICIIQLPSDFEEKYKIYRLKLGDKHTERALSIVTEAQERAVRDLTLVSGQMDVFANQFSALSVFQKEIEKNSQTITSLQEVLGTSGKVYESLVHSMEPILSIARDAQLQIERLGIGKLGEQLRISVENINSTASTVQTLINEKGILDTPIITHLPGPKKESAVTFAENPQVHFLNDQLKELVVIVKSIEEKIPSKKLASGTKFPFTIPAGTRWESIIIQFTTPEYVNVQVAGHSHPTGYADMGFVDKRTNKPNLQWIFLLILAKNGGELSPSSGDASDNFKKQKQLLSEKLKGYFDIMADPFEPYKNKYKILITVIPPPTNNPTQSKGEENSSTEIEDIFREYSEE